MHLVQPRVIVIGGGVAGLATALELAPLPVTVLAGSPLGDGAATALAQGGIAAAMGADDEPSLHAADTVAAGAGLTDPAVASRVASAAPECIEDLCRRGVAFDRDAAGALALGLEAAHSRHRIVHAGGDATGRVVLEALISAVRRNPSIEILENVRAIELAVHEGRVSGVHAVQGGEPMFLAARGVVLATGGVGGLYAHTTNPLGATGSGLALAARAGAVLRDVEFVQFHPTAIAVGGANKPLPLATEALRGEGAVLINGRGERFMETIPGGELAPRDVVARAVWGQIEAGAVVFLDARAAMGERFAKRFPSVAALCREAGIDPVKQAIPVQPAAHYHMGGVAVDERGRTSVAGLWACGEVAASGLHGANRLASNSLLEALAFARWIGSDIAGAAQAQAPKPRAPIVSASIAADDTARVTEIRRLMSETVGVVRDEAGLTRAIDRLGAIAWGRSRRAADLALIGLFMAAAARERRESRGGHFRRDHPTPIAARAHPIELTLGDLRNLVGAQSVQYAIAGGA
ncbi:MAG: L-aspartate oxidase [Betaproteobacteria bacterium]|nr:L-aspartate oxidase [Betaproteobacteria bacterium]